MGYLKASIILPQYNLAELTVRCLEALAAHTAYKPYEVLIVDNGSEPLAREMVCEAVERLPFERAYLLEMGENTGWVGACNEGYEAAVGEWIVLLNNDTVPGVGWLEALIGAMERDPLLGIVGGVTAGGRQWQGIDRLRERWTELAEAPGEPGELGPWLAEHCAGQVRIVEGMVAFYATAIRRDVIEEIGFLDERYGLGLGDDDDLCWRARSAGWRVGVALDSFVEHDHRRTFERMAETEGLDWRALQRQNLAFYQAKRMGSRAVDEGTVLIYVGEGRYITGIPARDLMNEDLVELEDIGWGRWDVLETGLYVEVVMRDGQPVPLWFPPPFCGCVLADGTRCRRQVPRWGLQCAEHTKEE